MKYVSDMKELEAKKFATPEELKAAEEAVLSKHKAEQNKQVERKEDASKVEAAFASRNAARAEYNASVLEAGKVYNKAMLAARDAYAAATKSASVKLTEAEGAYAEALDEFTAKHPEGYHMTLHDGDNVTTITRWGKGDNEDPFVKFNNMIDEFFSEFVL